MSQAAFLTLMNNGQEEQPATDGTTALIRAAHSGSRDAVAATLKNGADPSFISRINQSALNVAIENRYYDSLDMLLTESSLVTDHMLA